VAYSRSPAASRISPQLRFEVTAAP